MFRSFARLFALLVLATTLAACGSRPKPAAQVPQVFDIGVVTVTANGAISARLLSQIDSALERAVAATVRPVPMPAADMTVRVVSIARGTGLYRGHARAEVSVMLTDPATQQTILVRNYLVLAFSEQGKVSAPIIADTIAARLRAEFSLATPPIVRRVTNIPALSTIMADQPPADEPGDKAKKPQVIPLSTAPVVGVDQDPMLNSKTKVKPEVAAPAKVEPALKAITTEPAAEKAAEEKKAEPEAHTVEEGAKAKVVIQPAKSEPATAAPADAAPADDEICVETLEKKC